MSRFFRIGSRLLAFVLALDVLATGIASAAGASPSAPVVRADLLSDVPQGHWAYDAVAQLVRDGLIVGYPDGTFKGPRPMTRYEAAVLTYRALEQIEAQMEAGKAVEQADIDAVKNLMTAFADELKSVEGRVAALQSTVDSQGTTLGDLKKEADATQLRVNQGKVGFNFMVRPGTSSYTLNGVTATGASIPAGTTVAFGTGSNSVAKIGSLNTGTMIDVFRPYLGGQIDPRWSYGLRISDQIKYNPFDATSTSPSYCAGATAYTAAANCAYTVLNFGTTPPQNTLPLNLDYAYVQYSSPGGITSQLGRFVVGSYSKFGAGPNGGLIFGGQSLTGANIGYNDPHGRFYAAFYYGQPSINSASLLANGTNLNAGAGNLTCTQGIYGLNATTPGNGAAGQGSFTGINPYCIAPQSEQGGWFVYDFTNPRVALGMSIDNQTGKQYTFYNPSQVSCSAGAGAAKMTYQAASAALCTANFPTGVTSAPVSYFLNGQTLGQIVEGYASIYFGPSKIPTWNLQLTYDQRLGVNPFTGARFVGSDAESVQINYASKGNLFAGGGYTNPFVIGGGRRNANVFGLGYTRLGLNSLANIDGGPFVGATNYENNLGFTGFNGLQAYGLQIGHWVTDSVRFGVTAIHLQNDYNTAIPTSTGGFITQLNENQLNFETYLYFF